MTMRMSRVLSIVLAVLLAATFIYRPARGSQRPAAPSVSQALSTAKAVAAANAFLGTLDADGRRRAHLDLSTDIRKRWSNLPTGVVMQVDQGRPGGPFERNGVKLGSLSASQQDAALAVVASTLSQPGYQKVLDIVNGDQVLEGRTAPTRAANNLVRFGR